MEQLKGTGVAIVTPFDKNKSVDFKALEKVIDHIISGGVQYIVTLGTTGETPVLSKEEKIDIVISAEQVVYQNTTKDITANVIKAVAPTKDLTKDKQK
jgi:dihydrodipicolinate synthase/N-acetylneuraminate lyase